ncbi:MAG TPA: hypothetical protein VLK56_02270 [Solirubrobacterales bacterium]|nr:hypothetical protein [Solirubrobacterales bacterium]
MALKLGGWGLRCCRLLYVRPISQHEAEQMRETLKEIAGFRNEALDSQEPGQAAAISARNTLEELKLFFQRDALGSNEQGSGDPPK